MKPIVACLFAVFVSCAALASDIPSFASPAKIDGPPLKLNAVAVEVQREFLRAALERIILPMRTFVNAEEPLVLPPPELMERFAAQTGESACRKKPNQPPQRNAGSRPSSADSSASETPSSLGPRG